MRATLFCNVFFCVLYSSILAGAEVQDHSHKDNYHVIVEECFVRDTFITLVPAVCLGLVSRLCKKLNAKLRGPLIERKKRWAHCLKQYMQGDHKDKQITYSPDELVAAYISCSRGSGKSYYICSFCYACASDFYQPKEYETKFELEGRYKPHTIGFPFFIHNIVCLYYSPFYPKQKNLTLCINTHTHKKQQDPFEADITLNDDELLAWYTFLYRQTWSDTKQQGKTLQKLPARAQYTIFNLLAQHSTLQNTIDYISYCCDYKKIEVPYFMRDMLVSCTSMEAYHFYENDNEKYISLQPRVRKQSSFKKAFRDYIQEKVKDPSLCIPLSKDTDRNTLTPQVAEWEKLLKFLQHERFTVVIPEKNRYRYIIVHDALSKMFRVFTLQNNSITMSHPLKCPDDVMLSTLKIENNAILGQERQSASLKLMVKIPVTEKSSYCQLPFRVACESNNDCTIL